jgi:dTDP-4-amino-4,6-dideoxygalactose transaminase
VPVYLRLPVLLADESARRRAVEALTAAGIGASGSYPESLADVSGLRPSLADASPRVSGARFVARRILTLPTHAFVTAADVARTVEVIEEAMDSIPAGAAGAVSVR